MCRWGRVVEALASVLVGSVLAGALLALVLLLWTVVGGVGR